MTALPNLVTTTLLCKCVITYKYVKRIMVIDSVVDLHHFDADTDSTYYPDADPDSDFYLMRIRMRIFILDPNPSFQIKAPTLEKMLKQTHIPYILNFHLQVDADPACHFDADADPDPVFYLMRIFI
jgi:hypothetical protein